MKISVPVAAMIAVLVGFADKNIKAAVVTQRKDALCHK
jgi:hypothetical protein